VDPAEWHRISSSCPQDYLPGARMDGAVPDPSAGFSLAKKIRRPY